MKTDLVFHSTSDPHPWDQIPISIFSRLSMSLLVTKLLLLRSKLVPSASKVGANFKIFGRQPHFLDRELHLSALEVAATLEQFPAMSFPEVCDTHPSRSSRSHHRRRNRRRGYFLSLLFTLYAQLGDILRFSWHDMKLPCRRTLRGRRGTDHQSAPCHRLVRRPPEHRLTFQTLRGGVSRYNCSPHGRKCSQLST